MIRGKMPPSPREMTAAVEDLQHDGQKMAGHGDHVDHGEPVSSDGALRATPS